MLKVKYIIFEIKNLVEDIVSVSVWMQSENMIHVQVYNNLISVIALKSFRRL